MAKINPIFVRKKESVASSTDNSRKGNIDEPIVELIDFINGLEDYVTTSSCSGRIIILKKGEEVSIKKGCKWILTSHEVVDPNQVVDKLSTCVEKNMILKFEPFILHVQCRNVTAAKKMQDCAFNAGYRNSGSVFGRQGSITLAVRGTHGLEVPLSDETGLIVSNEYIKYVVNKANEKMCENLKRIDSFSRAVFGMKVSTDTQEIEIEDKTDCR
ncbi:tRNA wybutosine-synthesizing protein 3 homolog [Macrosteles quadrilineatus]|uniref:tRNA wybutosine-synthesizing protein 3 homolog n=1 Tax=Macrosteles quadrilineatus TaxID=74068 RepID=UPI0023E13355|nr:tRNA wybutosine-synthesizing protein 3 homolog [Macrosteles quadrilineatus]